MHEFSGYALPIGATGEQRLRAIHELLEPGTRQLLDAAGIRRGMRVADVGCGVGTVTTMMGELVGPAGQVIGIDVSPAQLERGRAMARARAILNCDFVEADALATGLPEGEFDLVYGRLLLTHLPDPLAALREMRRLLVRGGALVVEDCEVMSAGSEPESALGQFAILLTALGHKSGTDWNIGRRLAHLVREAGFVLTTVRAAQGVFHAGEHRRLLEWTIAEAGPALVNADVITAADLEQTLTAMARATADEDILVFLPRMLQVIATKH